jgi:hypothetical protein
MIWPFACLKVTKDLKINKSQFSCDMMRKSLTLLVLWSVKPLTAFQERNLAGYFRSFRSNLSLCLSNSKCAILRRKYKLCTKVSIERKPLWIVTRAKQSKTKQNNLISNHEPGVWKVRYIQDC